ncbi:protease I [Herbaspirillum sp. SJZ107]|nr:protease I [Herbaspirillum sp. SJZ107]
MIGRKKLDGQRIAVLATDGFEQVELSVPVTALEAAGALVEVVSLHGGTIRGVNLNKPARRAVDVDRTIDEVSASDYDGLLIPGGFINPDLLRQSAAARELVREFDAQGKPIATLCHGPWLLASTGLADGRALTSWPGVRDDMVNAGATWLDQEVVRDGNWLTSRGPQDMVPFVREMIQLYAGGPASKVALKRRASDPQRERPAPWATAAMRLLPSASMGTVLGIALIGGGLYAASRAGSRMGQQGGPSR